MTVIMNTGSTDMVGGNVRLATNGFLYFCLYVLFCVTTVDNILTYAF